MNKLIYLDNAATTYPKPDSVIRAVSECMRSRGGNPGRGSHRLSTAADSLVFDCRAAAAEMFGARPENVVFTLNATHALNMAIKGIVRPGCHVLIDNFAHNASYRPLCALADAGVCEFDIYDASGTDDETIGSITKHLRDNTTLLIATHQSNICSKVLPVAKIGQLCGANGIHFCVDAAQSAGHLPINVRKMGIGSLCMPGHKGLFGPMGIGMLITDGNAEYSTIIEGGAGINSLDTAMPDELPERLEAGTLPLPAIGGLLAGLRYVKSAGIAEIHIHECAMAAAFTEHIKNNKSISLYGSADGSVVSFRYAGYTPSEYGAYMARHGICLRSGYHCAPLAHRTLSSIDEGLIRVSFSYMNRMSDITALCNVIDASPATK